MKELQSIISNDNSGEIPMMIFFIGAAVFIGFFISGLLIGYQTFVIVFCGCMAFLFIIFGFVIRCGGTCCISKNKYRKGLPESIDSSLESIDSSSESI